MAANSGKNVYVDTRERAHRTAFVAAALTAIDALLHDWVCKPCFRSTGGAGIADVQRDFLPWAGCVAAMDTGHYSPAEPRIDAMTALIKHHTPSGGCKFVGNRLREVGLLCFL